MNAKFSRDPATELLEDAQFKAQVVHIERLEAVAAEWAELPPELDARLADALARRGVDRLYSHQRQAFDTAMAGSDFVVVTPTASGKTLCYNLPVAQRMLSDPDARALYLFPTKALAQDQQAELNELIGAGQLPISAVTYDGDTPQAIRAKARDDARIILSNPDMLHSGVMPNHAKWVKFFAGLQYIVVDEMHTYRGVFGSHVANVFRRLVRIARHYGANPVFILCSATLENPSGLASMLTGRSVVPITRNGAPRSAKTLIFYNPPVVDPVQGIRRSSADESVSIAEKLLRGGVRTILFARSRVKVELLASYLNERFRNLYTENDGVQVEPYRSGLLPSERRAIESGLRSGTIHGVVSTNALELGIDIGGLDAAVIAGWPGSIASFWQQSGRAGRRQSTSLAVLVASASPIDQYLLEHPERVLRTGAEEARIDPDNPYIYTDHIKCAAFELPFADNGDDGLFGAEAVSVLEYLSGSGMIRHTAGRWYWSDSGFPAEKISLRSATSDNIVIIDTTGGRNTVIGEMDRPSAKELVFDDAVYIHKGRQFIVLKLDIENRECRVEERDVNYYTDAIVKHDLKILSEDETLVTGGVELTIGDLLVRSSAEKYKKLRFHTNENIGYGEIYLPPEEMQTRGAVVLFRKGHRAGTYLASLPEMSRAAVLASMSYSLRSLTPAALLCDRTDLGATWRLVDDHFASPAIYLWDRYPGGTGLAEALPARIGQILAMASIRTSDCPCEDGCPSCIGVPDSEFAAVRSRKVMVRSLLSLLLDGIPAC